MRTETLIKKWKELTQEEKSLSGRLEKAGEKTQKKTELLFVLRGIIEQKLKIEDRLLECKLNLGELL
jgi:hypothetical protein